MQKRIGILYYPGQGYGGLEKHIGVIIHGVKTASAEVEYVLIGPVEGQEALLHKFANIPVIEWSFSNIFDFKAGMRLFRLLRKERISLIHMHNPEMFVLGGLAGLFCGIPRIITIHIPIRDYYQYGKLKNNQLKKLLVLLFEWLSMHIFSDQTLFVSLQAYRAAMHNEKRMAKRAHYIPNGIDRWSPFAQPPKTELRSRLSIPNNSVIICYLGRLDVVHKGLDTLFEAMKHTAVDRSKWQLWLIGEGPAQTQLKKMACDSGLIQNVKFWGFKDDPDILLSASDIFVLPSRFEGMSFALLEALSHGLAPIVTNVGDNALLVKNQKGGLVVPPNDHTALSEALEELILNQPSRERMGRLAMEQVKQYDESIMLRDTTAIYQKLLCE